MVDALKLKIKTLPFGTHTVECHLDESFFNDEDQNEVRRADVEATVEVTRKSENTYHLEISCRGTVTTACDRCLDEFEMPIENEGHLFFEQSDEPGEVSDELVMISRSESRLDLKQYIYEFISLAIPAQKYHPEDENGNSACDPEMIRRLNEIKTTGGGNQTDPRWDKLKDLVN